MGAGASSLTASEQAACTKLRLDPSSWTVDGSDLADHDHEARLIAVQRYRVALTAAHLALEPSADATTSARLERLLATTIGGSVADKASAMMIIDIWFEEQFHRFPSKPIDLMRCVNAGSLTDALQSGCKQPEIITSALSTLHLRILPMLCLGGIGLDHIIGRYTVCVPLWIIQPHAPLSHHRNAIVNRPPPRPPRPAL